MVEQNKSENSINIFDKEISRLPEDIKKKLESKKKVIDEFVKVVNEKTENKAMGFYLTPDIVMKNNYPTPDFDKLTLNFLLDDFEKPIQYFDMKFLFGKDFEKYLSEEKKKDQQGQEYSIFTLKSDKNIKFLGSSISMIRENCFDSIYDDLKRLGSSFVYSDERGFISALKTIDIHRNMLLQKFEKYVVVYAGAGSWLRGEKSNDFDVFIVIDDTDVKKLPRYQVKDQLTKIIWQMSGEVAALTGIQIHIQVYLLTDFWDALKDAHPVMFTFLRDGVPFYDRGIYSAWKELLKLGKIRPSAEAIDMHMNVGTQLFDKAKKMIADIVVHEIYNAVLSPSQAILMLKGYNPTTPKETVRMFKDVLLAKEKSVSQKDVEVLENTVKMFKELEHNKETAISGKDVDKMIKDGEEFLKNIKKMFEQITEERNKESIVTSYNELLNQVRSLPGYMDIKDKDLLDKFREDYVDSGKLPSFIKASLKNISKAKEDYDKGKITVTEVNKILKEVRNVLSEIKNYRDKNLAIEGSRKKIIFYYDDNKQAELCNKKNKIYLINISDEKVYEFNKDKFASSKLSRDDLQDTTELDVMELEPKVLDSAKEILKAKKMYL